MVRNNEDEGEKEINSIGREEVQKEKGNHHQQRECRVNVARNRSFF